MKYLDEFRNPEIAGRLFDEIRAATTRPWAIMEVCGGQTHSIIRNGIDQLLPPEIELAKRFGVARSSIREVMSAWVRMGMVTRNKGAGTVLATEIAGRPIHMPLNLSLEVQSLSRMMEVRTPLEIEAARLAATAADTRARDAIMRSMLELMDAYESGGDWRPADGAFHAEIHAATGNPLFGQIISTRVDIMPKEWCEELAGLQDRVDPTPWKAIRRRLQHELGAPPEEVFAEISRQNKMAANVSTDDLARLARRRRPAE